MFHAPRRACCALALGLTMALVWECASAETLTHTVRPGDNVTAIAERYGVSARDVIRANHLVNASTIHSGLELVIPVADRPNALAMAQTVDAAPAAAGTVIVEPGAAETRDVEPAAASPVSRPTAVRRPAPAPQPKRPAPKPAPAAAAEGPAGDSEAIVESADPAISGDAPTATSAEPAETPAPPSDATEQVVPAQGLFSSRAESERGYSLMTALDFALKLILVLILAYVCMLALKKFSQRRVIASGKGAALRVVDTVGLAPNRQLHIVALGDRAFLLGSTPESISLISDISHGQDISDVSGGSSGEQLDPAFSQRLKEIMKAAPAQRKPQRSGVGLRLSQAAQLIKARSNQLRPLGEIIDETVSQ